MKSFSDSHGHGEISALGRIEVDATEGRQKQQGSTVIGGCIVNLFPSLFGIQGHSRKPLRQAFAEVFLKESLSLDAIRIAAQDQGPVPQKRQDEVGHAVVVGEQISFRVAGLWEIDFVKVA